jgi:DNA-directed RNA polymerase specialized sigma24 family protein
MGTPESSTRSGRKPSSDFGGGLGSCSSDMAPHRDSCHPRIRATGVKSRSDSSCSGYWEAVLRSVAKAFQRKGEYASSIGDLESYLLTAFHHRFHRFLQAEHERHETFQSVSGALDLDLLEAAQNAEWVLARERKIAIRQVTDRMDGWTKKVWQARQYGYSWKEISTWLGITEHQAKMKFQYGVEKTRASLLRSVKAAWVKKSG